MALTAAKAKKILEDGTIRGKALTEKQKKFFGAVAGGATPLQKLNGGWLDKFQDGGDVSFDSVQRAIRNVESLDGKLMWNPESTATGLYGQLFSQVKNDYPGTRKEFAADTLAQKKFFKNRFFKGLPSTQTTSLVKDANDIYNEYASQIPDFNYSKEDLAVLSNFLGRQGTREYLGYHVRDKKPLEQALPNIYGSDAKQRNKTPEQYLEQARKYYKEGGWLDKFDNGGVQPNYNNSNVSLPPGFKGYGYDKGGRAYNGAWNGPVAQDGYTVPPRKGVRLNYDEQGNVIGESTHIMATETLDGKNWFSFPTLFQDPDGTWVDMSEQAKKDWKPVYEEAKKRGEVIDFGTDKEAAIKFGEGSWKTPKQQMGGSLPGATGMMYARTSGLEPLEAQYGREIVRDNTSVIMPRIPSKVDLFAPRRSKTDEEIAAERKAIREKSNDNVLNQYSMELFNPDNYTRENLSESAAGLESMFRVSDKPNFFDDWLNPLNMIGSMAASLGQAPLQAEQSDSYLPYVTAVGVPLTVGALGGIGAKSTGQFVNNIANPIAGLNVPSSTSSNLIEAAADPGIRSSLIRFGQDVMDTPSAQIRASEKFNKNWFNNPETIRRVEEMINQPTSIRSNMSETELLQDINLYETMLDKSPKFLEAHNLKISTERQIKDLYAALAKKNLEKVQQKGRFTEVFDPDNIRHQDIGLTYEENPNYLGFYKGRTNQGTVNVSRVKEKARDVGSVFTHEDLHAITAGRKGYTDEATQILNDAVGKDQDWWLNKINTEKDPKVREELIDRLEYLSRPQEIHARVHELRKAFNLKPGQEVSAAKIDQIMMKGLKGETPVSEGFFRMLGDKENFRKIFNKLPAFVPAAVGLGAASQNKNGGWLDKFQDGGSVAMVSQYEEPAWYEKVLDYAASPMTALSYIIQGKDLPDTLPINAENRNAYDMVTDMINPFAWYAYAESADRNISEGNYTDAAFDALGAIPIVPAWLSRGKQVGKYLTTQTPLKNAYKLNPWRFKENPQAYYHRSPNLNNIINRETGVLQGFGQSNAGKLYNEFAASNPGGGINLLKGANSRLYFSKGVPLDYGRYNPRSSGMSGQGYRGPYIVEVEGVPMGSSVKGRAPKPTPPTNLEGYGVSRRPISLDEANFYKEDWLRGYKRIEIPNMQTGGVIEDDRGQWAYPGEITKINSNNITMKGVNYPVLGISDTGDTKMMQPGKDYKFKGNSVTEFPMAKDGKSLVELNQLTNFTNYNTPQPGGWLDKYH